MPQANTIQTNFTSGEVSPKMYGRIDINRYFNGAKSIKNFLVQPQGGVLARSGSRYVDSTKTHTKKSRLIPFQFSSTQAYVLEFGDLYFRIYKDGALVLSGTPVEVTTPYGENDLAGLSWTQSADVLYITHPNFRPRKVTRTSHTSWTISEFPRNQGPWQDKITGTNDQLYISISSRATRVYLETASAGTVANHIISVWLNGEYRPMRVNVKNSNTSFDCYEFPFIPPDPNALTYQETTTKCKCWVSGYFNLSFYNRCFQLQNQASNKNAWLIGQGMTDGVSMVNADSSANANLIPTDGVRVDTREMNFTVKAFGSTPFVAGDVNRYIKLAFSSFQIRGKVTAYTSSSQITVKIEGEELENFKWHEFDGSLLVDYGHTMWWAWEEWDATRGFPSTVCFHEQRLVFANTVAKPQTIWMSKTGDYEDLEITNPDNTVTDTNGIEITIASNTAEPIIWMTSGPVMLIGTQGGEFQLKATSISEPITPTNFTITNQSAFGSQLNHRGLRSGVSTLFIQRAGRKIRELTYSFEIDAFLAKDISILSSHIFASSGAKFATQQLEPNITCWFLLGDGTLAALTYERDQEVVAWHRHSLGGNGVVESIAVVPSSDLSYDSVYMIVNRTIGGATKRYVERFENDFPVSGGVLADAFMVDCGLSYIGAPATNISGLTHLEGQTVHVLADGIYVGTKVVSSGAITLSVAASKVHVGYLPDYEIETLPSEGGSAFGTSQGKMRRPHNVGIKFHNAVKFSLGRSLSNLYSTVLNSGSLFTGDQDQSFEGSYDIDGTIFIKNPEPFPMTILAIMPQLVTHD